MWPLGPVCAEHMSSLGVWSKRALLAELCRPQMQALSCICCFLYFQSDMQSFHGFSCELPLPALIGMQRMPAVHTGQGMQKGNESASIPWSMGAEVILQGASTAFFVNTCHVRVELYVDSRDLV